MITCLFVKRKAAYEMRISNWSSDVCSSDLFATAILGANMSGLEAILSPDFTIWYNFSDATLSREQALAFFGKYFATVSVRFRDIRRLLTPQGWVQQHRVNADGPDGFQIRGKIGRAHV